MSNAPIPGTGLSALVAALLFAACSSPEPAPQPVGGGVVPNAAPQPAAPATPQMAPPVKQPAMAPPATAPSTAPAAPAFTRSGNAPNLGQIKSAVAGLGEGKPDVLGKPLALGDGRFVAAVHRGKKVVQLFVLSENGGAAQVEGSVDVKIGKYWDGEGEKPTIPAWEAGDLDADGEPEAWALIRFPTAPEPAVGGFTYGVFVVLDVDPAVSIAFRERTQVLPQAETPIETRGRVTWKDDNGDGHPDINIRYKECSTQQVGDGEEWKRLCETSNVVRHWDQSTDTWIGGKS